MESQDNRIDAVGACVGMKGVRIHAIVRELNNENIDVINYSEDMEVYIQRALSPAKLKFQWKKMKEKLQLLRTVNRFHLWLEETELIFALL